MRLNYAKFEFIMPDNRVYSAWWYKNGITHDSPEPNRKYEVAIYRGGGYKVSYYTDHRICEKNSKEFINIYLKSLDPVEAKHNSST